jgi:hypothetical protein
LRDDIRDNATVLTLGPLGASDVDTLLRRLEKELNTRLAPDLRNRLREYSQGFPWLFKKLAGHLLREVRGGATQEQLASEALNVQNLFAADLAELGPAEQEALRHIARYAPIPIGEVMERVTGPIVESLVNRRLIVQVGERLDTYWDIFRDYLNTGRVPVEDSYILRLGPLSVARLLREVVKDEGDSHVRDIASRLATSENSVFNHSRELRLLGATAYEPNRVRLLSDIWRSDDREGELRGRVTAALRRHRAYSSFTALADRLDEVTINAYARDLPSAFPAVAVSDSTWISYARVYLQWFEYAGLATQRSGAWSVAPDGSSGVGELLSSRVSRVVRRGAFPHNAPGPALTLLGDIAAGAQVLWREHRRGATDLVRLGAVDVRNDGICYLREPNLVQDGRIVPSELLRLLRSLPGVSEGLAAIEADPEATASDVGEAVSRALNAEWKTNTTLGVGKHLRAWARESGLAVRPPRQRSRTWLDGASGLW